VVGLTVGGQGHKQYVLAADPFDLATAGDAARIGQQHDLQQHGGIVGGRTGGVVAVALMEVLQVEVVIDHVVEGIFKGAGQDLIRKTQRDHLGLVVIGGFVARHPLPCLRLVSFGRV